MSARSVGTRSSIRSGLRKTSSGYPIVPPSYLRHECVVAKVGHRGMARGQVRRTLSRHEEMNGWRVSSRHQRARYLERQEAAHAVTEQREGPVARTVRDRRRPPSTRSRKLVNGVSCSRRSRPGVWTAHSSTLCRKVVRPSPINRCADSGVWETEQSEGGVRFGNRPEQPRVDERLARRNPLPSTVALLPGVLFAHSFTSFCWIRESDGAPEPRRSEAKTSRVRSEAETSLTAGSNTLRDCVRDVLKMCSAAVSVKGKGSSLRRWRRTWQYQCRHGLLNRTPPQYRRALCPNARLSRCARRQGRCGAPRRYVPQARHQLRGENTHVGCHQHGVRVGRDLHDLQAAQRHLAPPHVRIGQRCVVCAGFKEGHPAGIRLRAIGYPPPDRSLPGHWPRW